MLIIATAVLIAWLFVELARFVLGDLRLERIRGGFLQGASSGSIVPQADPGAPPVATEHQPSSVASDAAGRSESGSRRSRTDAPAPEGVLYDEAAVEQAIRDRLYGDSRRRRT